MTPHADKLTRMTYKRIVEIISDPGEEFHDREEKLGAIYAQANRYMAEQEA